MAGRRSGFLNAFASMKRQSGCNGLSRPCRLFSTPLLVSILLLFSSGRQGKRACLGCSITDWQNFGIELFCSRGERNDSPFSKSFKKRTAECRSGRSWGYIRTLYLGRHRTGFHFYHHSRSHIDYSQVNGSGPGRKSDGSLPFPKNRFLSPRKKRP